MTRQQKVLRIIHEVADVHIYAASRAIQRSLAETMDEVTFVLDKASLPRPPALGIRTSLLVLVVIQARFQGTGHAAASLRFAPKITKIPFNSQVA